MIKRKLTDHLKKMARKFPVVSLTGPRQSGKTTLLKNIFPNYTYYNLERLDLRELVLSDPVGFLKNSDQKIIFDEAQNIPELFSYIQVASDEKNEAGQFILSGSQSFLLNEKISQSLAGRVSVNHLFPFELTELPNAEKKNYLELILKGFYPRVYDKKISPGDFYPSYLQTYIERDIRSLNSIHNLNSFSKFLGLCAGRVGQSLNITSLSNDAGIAVNTAKSWLSLLEASFIIFLLPQYHNNFNKRLTKAPKLYFYDTGVVSSLLRIHDSSSLRHYPLYGALFENFIIADIYKFFIHSGRKPQLFYWRESNGNEIDCIIEKSLNELILIEIKGGETFSKDFIKSLVSFPNGRTDVTVKKFLLHPNARKIKISDVQILSIEDMLIMLSEEFSL